MLPSLALIALAGCPRAGVRVIEPLPPPLMEPVAPLGQREREDRPPPSPPSAGEGRPGWGWIPDRGISRRWNCIVIHHTATAAGSAAMIDRWHREKGWEGLGYHFVIGNGTHSGDGEVEVGYRWIRQEQGAHCRLSPAHARRRGTAEGYYNEHGIGIVLVGNFDQTAPTERQMDALARLVRFLMERCNIPESRIFLHGDVDQTRCPGSRFSLAELKRRL